MEHIQAIQALISIVPLDDGRTRKASRRSITKGNKKRLSREEIEEKLMFPSLTGEFDDDSPLEKHCPRKHGQ